MANFQRPLVALALTEHDQSLLDYALMLRNRLAWSDMHFAHITAEDPQRWHQPLADEVRRSFGERAAGGPALHAVEGALLALALHRRDRRLARIDPLRGVHDPQPIRWRRADRRQLRFDLRRVADEQQLEIARKLAQRLDRSQDLRTRMPVRAHGVQRDAHG
jgi:hypothetical protein